MNEQDLKNKVRAIIREARDGYEVKALNLHSKIGFFTKKTELEIQSGSLGGLLANAPSSVVNTFKTNLKRDNLAALISNKKTPEYVLDWLGMEPYEDNTDDYVPTRESVLYI